MSDDILTHVYNACDPDEPATAKYFLDCSEARGGTALTKEFQGRLQRQKTGYLCLLFSGHVGCGKSSELRDLQRALEAPGATPLDDRYFPILLDTSDYLDDFDVKLIDLLLAIVTQLAVALRDELNIELKDSYFAKRLRVVKELALSEVELKEGELTLGGAWKVKIQALKRDPSLRAQVRDALQPHMTTLLEEINTVLERARLEVKKATVRTGKGHYKDIVLIVDNLEKMVQFEDKPDGLESQRELFLERYPQLTGIRTHVIYTVPLRLVRSQYAGQLAQRYSELFVLPMVKIMERGTRTDYDKGIAFLHDILRKRTGRDLAKVFVPEALEFLLRYSGGHMRDLMRFVRNACVYAEQIPIPLAAAHRSIQQTVRLYSTSIPEDHWSKLVALDRSPDQKIPGGDDAFLVMLENLTVLEYINGDGQDTPFSSPEPWYAVYPIVRELQKFKSTAKAQEATKSP